MAISPVARISAVTPAPAIQQTNSSHKNIETELTTKQQHLKKVSSDTTITATEREEKRRELQKEIDELNRKLRQEKLEEKEKEAEAAKKAQMEADRKAELNEKMASSAKTAENSSKAMPAETDRNKAAETDKTSISDQESTDKPKPSNMSVQDIQQMLSAEYLMQKDLVQEHVDSQKEASKNVLKTEISQDKRYGADTTHKEAELDAIREKEKFWSNAQIQAMQTQSNNSNQNQTALNTNAKIVTEQM